MSNLSPDYVAGFIDGEGCFELSLVQNSYAVCKRRFGWTPRIRFTITQSGESKELLEKFIDFFGCGKVRKHPSSTSAIMYCYTIESRFDIVTIAIPIFDQLPFIVKKDAYCIWREAALLITEKKVWHHPSVYLKYLRLRGQINPGRGRRRKIDDAELIRVLELMESKSE